MRKIFSFLILATSYLLLATNAYAHEAYVLTPQEFQAGLLVNSTNPFNQLSDPKHLPLFLTISLFVGLSFILIILWSTTNWSQILDNIVRKAKVIGPLIIRLAISASFFFAAQINSILGPELPLDHIPYGYVLRLALFAISIMVLFGFLTELAALIGLFAFLYISYFNGLYMITYANYFGELLVLLLFGSRFLSFDSLLFGKNHWDQKFQKFRDLEVPIVRVLYGVALIFAGYTIKFQHQQLSIDVYNQYHLINFFHSSAGFIAAGAGLSEILIGLFILVGFAMRWTILISLAFITLSILYFREMLWPHLMLYGISFSLLINSGDKFTIDHYLVPWLRKLLFKPSITTRK